VVGLVFSSPTFVLIKTRRTIMPYCLLSDLITAFGETELIQLTDRQGAGAVDETILDAAIAKADAEINQRLRAKGWGVPIASSSTDLLAIGMDITRFFLHVDVAPDPVKEGFERAIKKLDAYVKGLVDLDLGSLPVPTAGGAGDVEFTKTAADRVFTRETLQGF
jgi:phage gp36-like protein